MLYFAYGSNLSSRRLQKRVPSAQPISPGQISKHKLLFHKIGRDGSAKCNAFYTGRNEDLLYGAVYTIDPREKIYLDKAEGLGKGYETKSVTVTLFDNKLIEAFTYFATRISHDILPFHWYREHVLAGAREHDLPQHYIKEIGTITVARDNDGQRTTKEIEIYNTK